MDKIRGHKWTLLGILVLIAVLIAEACAVAGVNDNIIAYSCMMDADADHLFYVPNKAALNIYSHNLSANESEKLSGDAPTDLFLGEDRLYYTLDYRTFKGVSKKTGEKEIEYSVDEGGEFKDTVYIAAGSKKTESSPGLYFVDGTSEATLMYRINDGDTEIFRFEKGGYRIINSICLGDFIVDSICVSDDVIYFSDGYTIYRVEDNMAVYLQVEITKIYEVPDAGMLSLTAAGNGDFISRLSVTGDIMKYSYENDEMVTLVNGVNVLESKITVFDGRMYYIDLENNVVSRDLEGNDMQSYGGYSGISDLIVKEDAIYAYATGNLMYRYSMGAWTELNVIK